MQPLDPESNYTDAAVLDALRGRYGTRTMSYRYDRLNQSNVFIEPIDCVVSGSVSNNALADIKRTGRFRILDRSGINYLKDRIQPWARLAMPDGGFVEWPLGVFLLATPKRILDESGVVSRNVEAYDQLLVLKRSKIADRYTIAAGTTYVSAIATVAASFNYLIVPSSLTLPAALEWEPGTTWLRILNDLLGAINYESAWFDESGRLICRPYLSPAVRAAEYDYEANEFSVITGAPEQTLDLFDIPNRWVLVKSNPDESLLKGTYTNVNPASLTSTVSRGEIITDFRTEQDAADQSTIDAKAARLGFEASQVFENIQVSTAAMPMHSNADVVKLAIPGLAVDDKYSEHMWTLPLAPGARMTHTVRRVVTV